MTRSLVYAARALCVALPLSLIGPATSWADDPPPPERSPAAAAIAEQLEPMQRDRMFRTAQLAVQVVNVRTGEEVYAYHPERRLNPASTMKIVTAAAALKNLGPSFRYTTELRTDGQLDAAGVLHGNLYVRGTGDPSIVIEKLWKLLYDLRLEGVERIDGNVVFDEGFFEPSYPLPGWDKREDIENGPSYFPALSALSLNFNTVAVIVGPGSEVGGPARVQIETPVGSLVEVESQVITGPPGSRRRVGMDRDVDGASVLFKLTGSFPSDESVERYYRTVPDPTAYFMAAFRELEKVHGITVSGRHVRGNTPSNAELLVYLRSRPLAALLMDMNKYSNNFIAEQVLRTLGAEVHGAPGSTDKGLQVVQDYLVSLGLDADDFTLINGSGLSRKAYFRPEHLNAVLIDMYHDRQVGHEFLTSLAIAGRDGTLWRRLSDHRGRLRGKTGTLSGVHGLTGYIDAGDGDIYAFAFLANRIPGSSYRVKMLHERMARILFETEAPDVGLADESSEDSDE